MKKREIFSGSSGWNLGVETLFAFYSGLSRVLEEKRHILQTYATRDEEQRPFHF